MTIDTPSHQFLKRIAWAVVSGVPTMKGFYPMVESQISGLNPQQAQNIALSVCAAIDRYRDLLKNPADYH